MENISPPITKIRSKDFITYRRLWLDTCLEKFEPLMRGTVLDVGGKRENKRGSFNPPENLAKAWWYVNLDNDTHPDIITDVATLPVKSGSMDVVICTEVLEHLENPSSCAQEIHRILKAGGTGFFSVPFMYPVHADPYDYQRFTADGLRKLLSPFQSIDIYPMGGYLGILGMFIGIGIHGISGQSFDKKILRRTLRWISDFLCSLDLSKPNWANPIWIKFTTGYFVKVVK